MQDPDGDTTKDTVIRFRCSETTAEYINHVREMWDCDSDSEALRILIHSYIGLLHGDISAILDPSRLHDCWGDTGTVLAAALDGQTPVPEGLQSAQLSEVLNDVPILLGAAHDEAHVMPPEDTKSNASDEPS